MHDDAIPVPVDEEATTPAPRQTMAELVWGDEAPENDGAIAGAEFYADEPAQAEYDGEDYL